MDKKKLFLWALYDFANSIIYVNFLLYFAQWMVIDGGLSDFWYNAIFAIATVLLLFTAPILAAQTDRNGGRKYFLNLSTIGTFIAYGFAVWVASMGTGYVVWVAILFLIGQYFYQLSFVFYNPMLAEIADEKHRARASGIGQFANACGQVLGIGATLSLAGTRLGPLFPALIGFFVLALPMMIFYKESRTPSAPLRLSELKNDASAYVKKFYRFFAFSVATPMLIAFFLFNDALLTLSNNYSIILERVFATPDSTKSLLLMGVLVMSAIGGITFGWIADRLGPLTALKIILAGWLVALPLLAFAPTFTVFAILTIPVGLLIGSLFAVSRAYLSTLLPKEDMGYGFSFYTLAERFATFVGPLTWGTIISLGGASHLSYRVAIMSMAVFVLAGLLVLLFFRQRASPAIR
ncbi:MAG: MFS transporter [Candidatus Moranbacteria bacterium]|nr:MFS transporter [Candidatus Moranbacteria bacterium]